MIDSTREDRLIDTFATLADTLVADYDVVDLLQTLVERCADLFDIAAAGILLADADGELERPWGHIRLAPPYDRGPPSLAGGCAFAS